jgi:5-methyltetrahydropteroyltriglutamate--homocysteine methyltransferase
MLNSRDRILTTHTGSLPRGKALTGQMVALSKGQAVDEHDFACAIEDATRRVVRAQLEAGIDVGNDGEQGRESFVTYLRHRLSGFGGESQRPVMRDLTAFPTFLELKLAEFSKEMVNLLRAPKAVGDVQYLGVGPVDEECRRFKRITAEEKTAFRERFMTAASPGIVTAVLLNEHYGSHEEYVTAVANALRPEYQKIVSRGFVLQIDSPDLAMERHTLFADKPFDEFLRFAETNIAALNHALEGIPRDRVRLHACWGNYEAPHHLDVPLDAILPLLYRAHVGALVLPLANPRHEHEWRCFQRQPLPESMLLVAGVIDTTTNFVEHPEVVADRIERVASAVGDPVRVLAGADCGFDTAAGLVSVAEEVVWEKLSSLRAGAELAGQRLGIGA